MEHVRIGENRVLTYGFEMLEYAEVVMLQRREREKTDGTCGNLLGEYAEGVQKGGDEDIYHNDGVGIVLEN